jgi:hypothetical protein
MPKRILFAAVGLGGAMRFHVRVALLFGMHTEKLLMRGPFSTIPRSCEANDRS